MSVRVLLADDHPIFRSGLRGLLENQPELEVIGEIGDGSEAVNRATREQPDVVVMDLSMPGMNGMEATAQITAALPEVRVLVLSMHTESRFVNTALDAGASGYLLKDCAHEELVRAIDVVVAGKIYLSPGIARLVVEASKAGRSSATDSSALGMLTERERVVLQLLAEGASTQEIAERLHISPKTVGSHREHLMAKLDIHNVAGLTRFAIREGLASSAG